MKRWRRFQAAIAAIAVIGVLATAVPASGQDVVWDQWNTGGAAGPYGPSTDFVAAKDAWDSEIADDFDLLATITQVSASGVGYGVWEPNNPPEGVWVRFYAAAPTGPPQALMVEHFVPWGDPNLILAIDNIAVKLPQPFVATGRTFVSVQQKRDASNSNPPFDEWWWWGSNAGSPNGEPFYVRNPGAKWSGTCPTWCSTANGDVSFLLFGQLTNPPPPTINSLSETTVARSGRFLVHGSGFGSIAGQLLLGGVPAPVTKWTDGEIHAYVLGVTAVGPTQVSVVTDAGASSAPSALQVTEPGSIGGRVDWRFQTDSSSIRHRPGVGPGGEVYVNDVGGHLYALTHDGSLAWIFDTQGEGAQGPVVVGADGAIYVAADPLGPDTFLHAVNPDGTLRWTVTDSIGQGVVAGPAVGPDGNLYVVTQLPGLSAFAVSPQGTVLWNVTGFSENGQVGQEIVFDTAGQLHFCLDGFFEAIRLDGHHAWTVDVGAEGRQVATGPNGAVFVQTNFAGAGSQLARYDTSGNLQWTVFGPPTNALTAPDVGPDGAIYIVRNLNQVNAIEPNGMSRWLVTASGGFAAGGNSQNPLTGPTVSPDGEQIVIPGGQGGGQPGVVRAWSPSGQELWEWVLPIEDGAPLVPHNRARFAADSGTVYVGTSGPGGPAPSAFLYAIDAASPGAWTDLGLGLGGALGVPALDGVGALTSGSPTLLTLSNAAASRATMLFVGASRVDLPLLGGTLVPSPDLALPLITNASGTVVLAAPWPAGVPTSAIFYFQAWIADPSGPLGVTASNAIDATTP